MKPRKVGIERMLTPSLRPEHAEARRPSRAPTKLVACHLTLRVPALLTLLALFSLTGLSA